MKHKYEIGIRSGVELSYHMMQINLLFEIFLMVTGMEVGDVPLNSDKAKLHLLHFCVVYHVLIGVGLFLVHLY